MINCVAVSVHQPSNNWYIKNKKSFNPASWHTEIWEGLHFLPAY